MTNDNSMDEAVYKFYRKLLRTGFPHSGAIKNASIFLKVSNADDDIQLCGQAGNFMELYVKISSKIIKDVKYTCSCDPAANVAVEILCDLSKGKTLDEAAGLTAEAFCSYLDCESPLLRRKVKGLLDLFRKGISRHGG